MSGKSIDDTTTVNSLTDAKALLEAVGHPAFVVAADHTVAGYNDGLADLLGIEPEVHVGEDARESIAAAAYTDERREWSLADKVVEHPREAAAAFEGVERVDDRSRYAGEFVYEDRSTMQNERGEESLISFVTTPIFDDDGAVLAALEIVEEYDPKDGEFSGLAGVLAHDLRNPLEVAQTYTELAAEDIDGDHYERIESSLERMADIIDDTMTLYRQVEADDNVTTTDVDRLAKQAWETVETGEARLEAHATPVTCDRKQLLLLFENLFRNAVDHGAGTEGAATGQMTIRVGTLAEEDGFYVEDTGTGISPDRREVVLEHGHSTSDDGTGLGLTIVQQIVRNHGWEMTVAESAEGGARFEFVESAR